MMDGMSPLRAAAAKGAERGPANGNCNAWGGGEAAAECPSTHWRTAAAVILTLLAFRLVYAWLVPLDLVHDEAYYWDWSRRPDYGYYSKPPMVAWLIALSTAAGGSNAFAVRLPAVLLSTVGLTFVYLLGARLYGPRAGLWALLLSAATPGSAALGLLMTIDAPLLFCWSATLYAWWRFLDDGPQRWRWFALAALAAGLGVLSKQTMLGFVPLAGLFLLVSREDRRQLARPGIWLFAFICVMFLVPVAVWNAQHGWITVQHTRGHFAADPVGLGKRLIRSAEFLGGQFGVVSPVTAALLVALGAAALRSLGRWERRERYLLCFSAVPLSGVVLLSLLQRVEPNWPAAFYPAAIVLLAAWAQRQTSGIAAGRVGQRQLRHALAAGGVCVAITYLVPWLPGLQGSRLDAAVRLRGWSELGREVGESLAAQPRSERTLVVVAAGRAVGSELAFYMPQQPQVVVWNESGEIGSQYDVWGGPQGKESWNALIVTGEGAEPPARLAGAFASVTPLGRVTVPIGNGREHRYQLWRGDSLSRWPDGSRAAEEPQIASPAAPRVRR